MTDVSIYVVDEEIHVGKYGQKLKELRSKVDKNRPDMLLLLGKSLLAAFVIFTFLSGLVFTVIPLARNISEHVQTNIIQPINAWIAAEPVFGNHMMFVFQAAGTIMFLYFIRDYIALFFVWIMHLFEKKDPKAKKPRSIPTKTNAELRKAQTAPRQPK